MYFDFQLACTWVGHVVHFQAVCVECVSACACDVLVSVVGEGCIEYMHARH